MRKFLSKIMWFVLVFSIPFIVGMFLPATTRASKSILYTSLQKDSLMKNVASPRIIFIGGSNVYFGIDGQIIKDSLRLNPINDGIYAGIGLVYMMANALEYIKENDIVVVVPEYHQFYNDYAYLGDVPELVNIIFNININKVRLLDLKQLIPVVTYLPRYSISKFSPNQYFNIKKDSKYFNIQQDSIYGVNSPNKYGNSYKHWTMKKKNFEPYWDMCTGDINISVIEKIKALETAIKNKKASLYISYPGLQDASYLNSKTGIKVMEFYFKKYGFNILGTPERYIMPDSMLFDTPYHLNKKGMEYRTKLFIEDFKKAQATVGAK